MTPEAFPAAYEAALRSQRWERVAPLMHDEACVTFSTGAVHRGKAAVQRAFEANFAAIENEDYLVTELVWCDRTADRASYTFRFAWSGRLAGQPASGNGLGTITLARCEDGWRLLAETLERGS
jgi:ketosteroid isomerase-like protein